MLPTKQTREQYIEHYDNHYKNMGLAGAGTGEFEKKLDIWQRVGFKAKMKVLDYGCGWGAMLQGIKNPYLGVDISPEAVKLAKEKFPKKKFEVFEIGKLDVGTFDFVAAMSVFSHCRFEDLQDSLGDIKRALKPDGIACIDFIEAPERRQDEHIRQYPLTDFGNELTQAGFKYEVVDRINWGNGFTHTYLKVIHEN